VENNSFDVIIIGGSYSGLAAGMALGRALKRVLIIDSGLPCNRQTPHSHNFLTQDGEKPSCIAAIARRQVLAYDSVTLFNGLAVEGVRDAGGFKIRVASGEVFLGGRLIFATGIQDLLPPIEGLAACWGISVIHCPYCHGYEVRGEVTGILGNGDGGFETAILISNWTKDLTLFTNGPCALTEEQVQQLERRRIAIVDNEVARIEHSDGYIKRLVFKDDAFVQLKALYARVSFEQHCKIPESLGCELTEEGYIKIDAMQETTVSGVFACGDNVSRLRTVANAVSTGTTTGIMVSRQMIFEKA